MRKLREADRLQAESLARRVGNVRSSEGRRRKRNRFTGTMMRRVAWCAAVFALVAAIAPGFLRSHDAAAAKRTRSPFSATIALDRHVQTRTKQMVIGPQDMPKGWRVDSSWASAKTATEGPGWSCNGHTADLSSLVVRGAWSAQIRLPDPSGQASFVTSSVFVLATSKQAQTLFNIGRTYYPKYCAIVGKKQGGVVVLSLSRLQLQRVADQRAGFRTVVVSLTEGWGDLILLRRGQVLGELSFSRPSRAFPAGLEHAVIKKFAARLHV